MMDEVGTIINDIAGQMKAQPDRRVFEVTRLGSFTLRKVDSGWPSSSCWVRSTTIKGVTSSA